MKPALIALAILVIVYILFILGMIIAGKKGSARAIAGLIPDCIILIKNLIQDRRVPSRYRFALYALIVYLALPIDLVPDFIPIAGQLDDAIIVTVVLRAFLKGAGTQVVSENWKGPQSTLQMVLRLAQMK
jgi:uncharacterized membrane protein YkvA (DUF1232 family)